MEKTSPFVKAKICESSVICRKVCDRNHAAFDGGGIPGFSSVGSMFAMPLKARRASSRIFFSRCCDQGPAFAPELSWLFLFFQALATERRAKVSGAGRLGPSKTYHIRQTGFDSRSTSPYIAAVPLTLRAVGIIYTGGDSVGWPNCLPLQDPRETRRRRHGCRLQG